MNAKTAKKIRQQLRRNGVSVGHAEYKSDVSRLLPFNTGKLSAAGKPMMTTVEVVGTIRLAANCGRAQYHRAKASAA